MDNRVCLAHYPLVVVRIACRVGSRRGSYRLARFAAKFGPRSAFATSRTVSLLIAFGGPRRGQRRASRPAASTCRTSSIRAHPTHRRGSTSPGQESVRLSIRRCVTWSPGVAAVAGPLAPKAITALMRVAGLIGGLAGAGWAMGRGWNDGDRLNAKVAANRMQMPKHGAHRQAEMLVSDLLHRVVAARDGEPSPKRGRT